MSSRNRRLSAADRAIAANIPLIMKGAIELNITNAAQIKQWALGEFAKTQGLKLEYFEIAKEGTLLPVDEIDTTSRMFIAAYVGDVRLIDNMAF